jgi:SAM-dependent methyltransferase
MEPVLDSVLRDEADFANEDYRPWANQLAIQPHLFARYESPRELWDWRQMAATLLGDVGGLDLLDLGCGMGEESVYFATLGARVTGIDISEVGIASLQQRARHHGLAIRARLMRCDPTDFPAASFDRIHGMGILHHVGIHTGLREVRRLLRPGGVGVFLEPMGDNATIETVKRWLMTHARFLGPFDHVTDHEENLKWREVEAATAPFAETRLFPYHLLYRLKRFFPASALDAIRRIDHGVLAMLPQLRRYAGGVVIRVRV